MCKTEKFFIDSIIDRLDGVISDVDYLIENNSKSKDKLVWSKAKVNDLKRLLNSTKESHD